MDSKIKFRVSFTALFGGAMVVLASCNLSRNSSHSSDGTNRVSGFDQREDSIAEERARYLHQEKKQKLELDWLKLRTRVVQAQFVTNQARLAENTLAREMARFGSLDRRFPDVKGFIDPIQRKGWDARLLQHRREVSQAEARERLLAREMRELRAQLAKEGFLIPDQSVFDLSTPSNR